MEDITITITTEKIREAFQAATNEIFKSSYSNPVKDILEKSIKEQSGKIKEIVDGIIVEAITDPKFKAQIADAVIQALVMSAIKK